MILLLRMFEKQTLLLMLIFGLFCWGMTATVQLFLKTDKTIVLKIDEFETSVVGAEVKTPVEIENFLNHFVGLFYSYSSVNYENHIDRAIFYLKKNLILEFAPKLNSMFEKISRSDVLQASTITKISRIKDLQYEVIMRVFRRDDENERQDTYKLKVNLEKAQRTIENPYGLVIVSLEEFHD